MLSNEQVGDLVTEMVEARLSEDRPKLTDLIHGLVTGQRADALNVTMVLAGIMAMDLGDTPEMGFHRMTVEHADGTSGSAEELPGHVATFLQMVVAIGNKEQEMARDLFIGYVDKDGRKALDLLVFALDEVMHQNELCPQCNLSEGGLASWRA